MAGNIWAMAIKFLSIAEFAQRVGVRRDTLYRYNLPEPDAIVGTIRGWLPQTIDAWQARRPGQGSRKNPDWHKTP